MNLAPKRFLIEVSGIKVFCFCAVICSLLPVTDLFGLQPPRDGELERLAAAGMLQERQSSALRLENNLAHNDLYRMASVRIERQIQAARQSPAAMAPMSEIPENWNVVPSTGDVDVLVFLVDFADHRASVDFPQLMANQRGQCSIFKLKIYSIDGIQDL